MSHLLIQSTASQEVPLGIAVAPSDGDTEVSSGTIANTDIKIWKTGATSLVSKNSGGATYMSNGVWYCVLDATDTATLGPLHIYVHVSGKLALHLECLVVTADAYTFQTTGVLGANLIGPTTLTTALLTAISTAVGSGGVLDQFTVDHAVAGTVGKAIADMVTSGSANTTALSSLATAVAALPLLSEMLTAFADLAGTSPGGGEADELILDSNATTGNGDYAGWVAVVIQGTGSVQAAVVASYVGATRTCIFDAEFPTAFDATSQYVLLQVGG